MKRIRLPSRRRFLAGVGGAVVGLPFLEALAPKAARGQSTVIKRFGSFLCCNGVNMDRWFPNGQYGALTEAHLTGSVKYLFDYVRRMLKLSPAAHVRFAMSLSTIASAVRNLSRA